MLDRILFSVICFLMIAGLVFTVMVIDALAHVLPFWPTMAVLAPAAVYVIVKMMYFDR